MTDREPIEQTLDRARTAREVAVFVALVLTAPTVLGDTDAALALLAGCEGIAPPESIEEVDCVTIAAEAIREAAAIRSAP